MPPEFIINRFRAGGWGVTLNMDEKGLAAFCVGLRNNTQRLKRIFTQLEKHHQTDSDDVAVHYVEMLGDNALQVLQQTDAGCVAQLMRILRAGVAAADERRAVRWLRAVPPNS